uniref:Interferon-related developmental regulator 1 n=1 Tax=Panagrolaimus sp. JU765 TaxID=591449 RepID=A0AC34RJ56_9BILA
MGKGKNKSKDFLEVSFGGGKSVSTRSQAGDSEVSDLESVAQSSVAGDVDYQAEEVVVSASAIDDICLELIDKRNHVRLQGLNRFIMLARKSVSCTEMNDSFNTIAEAIERNLHHDDDEVLKACSAAALFSILSGQEIEDQIEPIAVVLRALTRDHTKSEALRASGAQALGLIVMLSSDQPRDIEDSIKVLYDVWSGFRTTSTTSSLFTASLASWVLLIHKANAVTISRAYNDGVTKLTKFLESTNVDIRIAAGEALAALYELGSKDDDDFEFTNHQHIKSLFEELSQDTLKYHAKKDKRMQRFSFRQIMDIIFNDIYPDTEVQFSKREVLEITSCVDRLFYDALCNFLQGSTNLHIQKNPIVREVFSLPPVPVEEVIPLTKQEKKDLRQMNNLTDKARKIQRSKQLSYYTCDGSLTVLVTVKN